MLPSLSRTVGVWAQDLLQAVFTAAAVSFQPPLTPGGQGLVEAKWATA